MRNLFIYPFAEKSSNVYVKGQGYKLTLFGGGGYLSCGTIFQKYHSTRRFAGVNVKRHLYKIALFWGGWGNISVSLDFSATGYTYIYDFLVFTWLNYNGKSHIPFGGWLFQSPLSANLFCLF